MFRCYVCKLEKEADKFNKDRTRPSGLMSKCKDCSKIYVKQRRLTTEGRAKRVVESRKWKRANKIKERAHKAVARAIKSGKLIKPNQCSSCPSDAQIEGHHPDYEKALEVVWVCQPCHNNIHRRLNATR